MASSSAISFTMATSLPRVGSRNSSISSFHHRNPRLANFRPVCCQVEDHKSEQQPATPITPPPATASPPPPPPSAAASPPPPPPPKAPAVSTKFSDIMAFSGPAPERINGRLAMVGFVSALAVELAKGDNLAVQLSSGGLTWFVGTAAVLSLASLVPLFKGVTVQSKSGGLMTSDAEMWNGRFAMLGLVALAFTEYLNGGPLV